MARELARYAHRLPMIEGLLEANGFHEAHAFLGSATHSQRAGGSRQSGSSSILEDAQRLSNIAVSAANCSRTETILSIASLSSSRRCPQGPFLQAGRKIAAPKTENREQT
jgi:hypothetical protein